MTDIDWKAEMDALEHASRTEKIFPHHVDWKAEMAALNASLPARLERLAKMAEKSNHHVNYVRVMPAAGVADILYEALDEIRRHRGIEE